MSAAVEGVLKHAGFLLSGRKEGKWSIFHNSFRIFLGRETRKRFGQDDPESDKSFYTELAENAANVDSNSDQRWLELRYRSRAGDKEAVKKSGHTGTIPRTSQRFPPWQGCLC